MAVGQDKAVRQMVRLNGLDLQTGAAGVVLQSFTFQVNLAVGVDAVATQDFDGLGITLVVSVRDIGTVGRDVAGQLSIVDVADPVAQDAILRASVPCDCKLGPVSPGLLTIEVLAISLGEGWCLVETDCLGSVDGCLFDGSGLIVRLVSG